MANVEGRATAITVLTPVKPSGRFLLPIVFWVGRHATWTLKKLQTLSFIHFARWIVIRALSGRRRRRAAALHLPVLREQLQRAWDQYIDAFSEVVPAA